MKTVEQVLALSTSFLEQRGIGRARFHAEEVVAAALRIKRLELYMDFQRPLQEVELDECRKLLARRGKREPMQYIEGLVDFFNCQIAVDERVLIPRNETEILVSKIVDDLKDRDLKGRVLWDICCGSGCIGIALKKRFPELTVVQGDISSEALALAKQNAEANSVELEQRCGDFLEPFEGECADYVVCNPPYVALSDYTGLEPEVCLYEPKLALVGGHDGLDFYRRLAEQLSHHLKRPGHCYLEMGATQGGELMKLFQNGPWSRCEVGKDWSSQDRFFSLEIL